MIFWRLNISICVPNLDVLRTLCPQEGISTIITAISRSRMIFRRLETYIIYRIASSLLILGFFFFAIVILEFEIPTWVLVRPPALPCSMPQLAGGI